MEKRKAIVSILLIEDDELLRETIIDGLALHGYRVHGVPDMEHAAAFLRHVRPDAILTDFSIPDAPSRGAVRHLRSLMSGVPLVLLTGWRDLPYEASLGADAILYKPIEADALAATVRDLLSQASSAPARAAHSR